MCPCPSPKNTLLASCQRRPLDNTTSRCPSAFRSPILALEEGSDTLSKGTIRNHLSSIGPRLVCAPSCTSAPITSAVDGNMFAVDSGGSDWMSAGAGAGILGWDEAVMGIALDRWPHGGIPLLTISAIATPVPPTNIRIAKLRSDTRRVAGRAMPCPSNLALSSAKKRAGGSTRIRCRKPSFMRVPLPLAAQGLHEPVQKRSDV